MMETEKTYRVVLTVEPIFQIPQPDLGKEYEGNKLEGCRMDTGMNSAN